MNDSKDKVKVEIYLASNDYRLLEIAALHYAEVSDIPRTPDNMAAVYVYQALENIKTAMKKGVIE